MRRCLASLVLLVTLSPGQPPSAGESVRTLGPFLSRNCLACHNPKLRSGGLDLKFQLQHPFDDRRAWETVVRRLRTGEMPPKGIPRPKPDEVARVTRMIEQEYERRDRAAGSDPGRVTARRLNRYEYNNTIRDLTGVDFRPADDFPADDSGYGFDNIADVLSLSPVLMDKYLTAAEKIAERAIIVSRPQFRAMRTQLKGMRGVPLQPGTQGPEATKSALHSHHRVPAEADYDVRVPISGLPDGVGAEITLWLDGRLADTVRTVPSKPRVLETRVHLNPGIHQLGATVIGGAIDSIELRGPYNAVAPPLPESHRKIMFCGHDVNAHEPSCSRAIVMRLARRAFRRTPTETEIDRLSRLAATGENIEGGIRLALEAVLVSPHFLFRIEADDLAECHRISDFELATRLSYLLWSSCPDDELLDLAEQGRLRPDLNAQVRRMLRDPKSRALAENFAGQWLQLRNLDAAKPDPDRFPAFDDDLRAAMKQETELFFESVVREDRSILDFLDGRYSYLNERLALHYGIPGVEGPEFRRVALSGTERSGVLTHASVLTVSSYPTRTSPVMRGKWVLENFLNAAPPPPPPDIPSLDESALGSKGSLRQQLEQHRANPICASCHSSMDPLGFGLENYDAIGAWRTRDGKFPIDSTGRLPDGKSFRGPAELKTVLLARKNEFARCLVEKLLTYALGRGLEPFDRPAVDAITKRLTARGYRFSALVSGIVESMLFQMRCAEAQTRSSLSADRAGGRVRARRQTSSMIRNIDLGSMER